MSDNTNDKRDTIRQALELKDRMWIEDNAPEWLRYLLDQLDAKDTEIAELNMALGDWHGIAIQKADELIAKDAQIAERDATIARQAEEIESLQRKDAWRAVYAEDAVRAVKRWRGYCEKQSADNKAMKEMLEKVLADNGWVAIRDLLQSLKEPNP